MKKRIAVVTFWAILIVCTVLWAYQQGYRTALHTNTPYTELEKADRDTDRPAGLPESIGTPEDRYARFTWERMRLVNPATGEIPANIRQKELAFANSKAFKSGSATNTVWDHRGPFNVGGRTRAMAFDVDDDDIILAGGVTGGMWRSIDGGQSFTKTTSPDQLHSVTCLAQDKRAGKHNIWYHGTGEFYAVIAASSVDGSGNGIYKSTDSGQSWQLLSSTTSNTPTTMHTNGDFDFVWDIVVDHTDMTKDVLFAAVINGIYKSEDGGDTWDLSLGDTTAGISSYTTIQITDQGILYAAFGSGSPSAGIWRSADQGDTWTEITPASFPNTGRIVIGLNPIADKLYLLVNRSGSQHQLWHYTYLSGNGSGAGGHWDDRSANLPARDCEVFYDFNFGPYSSQSGYDMAIAISPVDTTLVLLGGTNVYRSTNGWRNPNDYDWIGGYQCDSVTPSNYVYPQHHPDQHKFLFYPSDPNVLYTANDGGLYKTNNILQNTVSWIPLDNGYMNSQFYTVAIEPGETNSNQIVGGMQDNGTYFTNNLSLSRDWKSVFYGDGAYAAITTNRDNYYLSWQGGKTFKFYIEDDGTVNGLTRIDPAGAGGYLFINPFILDPADDNTMYLAGGRYVWRNDSLDHVQLDGEEYLPDTLGWFRFDVSKTGNGLNAGSVSALDMSKVDNRTLYYGSSTGSLFRLDSLHTNNAVQVPLTYTEFPANGYIASIDVNENDPLEVLVTFSNYEVLSLFHSTDGGDTWSNISGDLEENPDGSGNGPAVIWAEMIDLGDSTVYLAGTSTGLYSTTQLNGANTVWRQEGEQTIGNVVINMIQTRSFDGLVVVGTHGNGVYSTRYKEYVSTGPELSNTNYLQLQCSPNPFRSSITIKFNMVRTEKVIANVMDISGKHVAQIFNGKLSNGEQTLHWNGTNEHGVQMPAGTYIVQLQTGHSSTGQQIIYTP